VGGLLARLLRELGLLDLVLDLGELVLALFVAKLLLDRAFICSLRKYSRWVLSICRLTRVRMRFSTCSTEISLSISPSTFSSRSASAVVSRITCLSRIFTARWEATVSAILP
jgi:hypothetical protein